MINKNSINDKVTDFKNEKETMYILTLEYALKEKGVISNCYSIFHN